MDGPIGRGDEEFVRRGEEESSTGGGGSSENPTREMEGGSMIGRLHGLQSRVVDSTAFFGIGLWQLLGRGGRHGPEEWDDYVQNWLTRGAKSFIGFLRKSPKD